MKRWTAFALAAILAAACSEDEKALTTPEAAPRAVEPAEPGDVAILGDEAAACPCWTARSLQAAFPAGSFFFEDLVGEHAAGRVVLQQSDVANARVLQALVEYDPQPAAAGDNWCQVATHGLEGLERESISALKISADEFRSCALLLQSRAEGLGLERTPD